ALANLLERRLVALDAASARSAVVEAAFSARSVAHRGDMRFADRTLSDFPGRPPLRRRMVCRARLFPHFLDARARRPAFRNRFALCAARPLGGGAEPRTRGATDDHGCVVG